MKKVYYTVDCGANLPYPLPDTLHMTQPPAVFALTAGRTNPKRADANHWRKLPSGYRVIHNQYLYSNRALAERLQETLTVRYAAQQAREAAQAAEREAKYQKTLETLTALANEFPEIPDFKRWEIMEWRHCGEFVIYLTPEESEGLACNHLSFFLLYNNTGEFDVLFVSNFEEYSAKTALIRGQEMQDEQEYEEVIQDFVAHAREILAKITAGVTP